MPHDNAALVAQLRTDADTARAIADYMSARAPDASVELEAIATRLRAAADALAAGGEAMDTINGVLAMGRSVRFYPLPLGIYAHTHGPQHDAEYEGDDLRGVLAAINAARRAEEPRHG